MKLSEIRSLLLREELLSEDDTCGADPEIRSLGCNSRTAEPGMLFFCKGAHFRKEYLVQARERGISACISQKEEAAGDVPLLIVRDVRRAMPLIAHAFYRAPEHRCPLVGITGTKGKTSCAYQLAGMMNQAYGGKYGLISTNEALSCGQKRPKSGTTPEALDLYALLNGFTEDGAKAAVMEVSSQGLQYDRVTGLDFAVGIWLNLSPDHISPTEHKDFEEYKEAKKKLFSLCRVGILNLDDPYAEEFLRAASCPVRTVSLRNHAADYRAEALTATEEGLSFTVIGPGIDREPLTLPMAGIFNVSNALCAVAAARELGIGMKEIREGLAGVTVKGRMEQFSLGEVRVIVDYAHNGLSFEKVFDFADRFYPDARKIVVYGCPGNKALDRRTEMSDVAGRRADRIILTDDDPAEEIPDAIMDEAETMLRYRNADFTRIHDRREAVAQALSECRPGDLLLLLGKGHETTQIVGRGTVEYGGDRKAAEDAYAALCGLRK